MKEIIDAYMEDYIKNLSINIRYDTKVLYISFLKRFSIHKTELTRRIFQMSLVRVLKSNGKMCVTGHSGHLRYIIIKGILSPLEREVIKSEVSRNTANLEYAFSLAASSLGCSVDLIRREWHDNIKWNGVVFSNKFEGIEMYNRKNLARKYMGNVSIS